MEDVFNESTGTSFGEIITAISATMGVAIGGVGQLRAPVEVLADDSCGKTELADITNV